MEIAEKLYNKGFISYPRTETDSFTPNLNVRGLVAFQKNHPVWGNYAAELVDNNKFQWPRNGGHDDKAHPPIHPVKVATQNNDGLAPDEWRVYELVTRHFLACCSQDAKGFETIVRIEIKSEFFHVKGLMIREYNYLDVYPYERWTASTVPLYTPGEQFLPTKIEFKES
jgi:DNA topoisomerase-3